MDISHRHSLHHNNASSLLGSASKTVHHLSLRVKINTVSEMYDPPETVPAPIIQESRGEPELASRTLTVFLHTSLLVYQVRVLCVMQYITDVLCTEKWMFISTFKIRIKSKKGQNFQNLQKNIYYIFNVFLLQSKNVRHRRSGGVRVSAPVHCSIIICPSVRKYVSYNIYFVVILHCLNKNTVH